MCRRRHWYSRVTASLSINEESMATVHTSKHTSMHEGVTLGLIVATSTWLWVAVVDAIAGDPFRTFTVLGGVVGFTVVHYLLNLIYGVVLVSGIRATTREPTLMMAIVFGFLMIEFGFAFLAAVF